MDINDLRTVVTLASLCCFSAIAAWVWHLNHRVDTAEQAPQPHRDQRSLGVTLG